MKKNRHNNDHVDDILSSPNEDNIENDNTEMSLSGIEKEKHHDNTSESNNKYDQDWKLEVFALIGFCLSGVIFIISGIKNGDILTIIGSSVWIASCLVWIIPYRRYL